MDFYHEDTKVHQNISSIITYELPDGQTGELLNLLEVYTTKSRDAALEIYVREQIKILILQMHDTEFSKYPTLSHFPSEVDIVTGEKHYTNEFSWSRGDLSILILLYKADKAFGTNHYSFIANTIGDIVAKRSQLEPINQNPFIRNGTAGIAQCFYTLYQQSNKSFYKEAYYFWITETHKYLSLGYSEILSSSILDSIEGVNLVLDSYNTDDHKDWTKQILL